MAGRRGLLVVAGIFALIAVSSALGAAGPGTSTPPKLPWAVPTVGVGSNPVGVAVDQATHTIYVANGAGTTVSVIDGTKCNARNASRCSTVASVTVGPNPLFTVIDSASHTLYASVQGGNEVAVVDTAACNATNTSGCAQTPAAIPFAGVPQGLALDSATHTLYVGDANEGPVSVVDTASCRAGNTSGCGQTPLQTAVGGDGIMFDRGNQSVYVIDFNDQLVKVFNGATCNAEVHSGCGPAPATVALPGSPGQGVVDVAANTVYVPFNTGTLGSALMIDSSTCNGVVTTGCGKAHPTAQVGAGPVDAIVDQATQTIYVLSEEDSSISVLNSATCNATTTSGCAEPPPTLAAGFNPAFIDLDPQTHTLYESSQDTDTVWVLDAAGCNATRTTGCTPFAPMTATGDGPTAVVADPATHTLYANDREANKVSVIDTNACNSRNDAGCGRAWPTISVGSAPQSNALNPLTHTLYVNNRSEHTLSVVDTASCNAILTSGCGQTPPKTAVGAFPQQVAVNPTTDTVYVANGNANTVSVVNGAVCNASNSAGCGQAWPTIPVGHSPQAIAANPVTNTIYVTNTGDDTVSVIDGSTCNGSNASGCGQTAATIPVGSAPRAVGIDTTTNTIFVGNRDDGTVSVIDGSTCNGTLTTGCGQTSATVSVGAPSTPCACFVGRKIAVDETTHLVYVPVIGDSDVAVIDGTACRGGLTSGCRARIVPLRMGGFGTFAAVDPSSATVYVGNNGDGAVSYFNARK